MKPIIDIRTHYYQGYGGPSSWTASAIHRNILLESRLHLSSEFAQGVAVAELKARWDREWNDADWLAAIQRKPLASPICGHCGGDTLDGTISCVNKVFCRKCEPFIEEYRARFVAEEQSLYQAMDDRQAQFEADRMDEITEQLKGAFHWRDNWYFKRLSDGSVNVMHFEEEKYLLPDLVIPENEWASIVCSVSAFGETGERWDAARKFHNPPLPPGSEPTPPEPKEPDVVSLDDPTVPSSLVPVPKQE